MVLGCLQAYDLWCWEKLYWNHLEISRKQWCSIKTEKLDPFDSTDLLVQESEDMLFYQSERVDSEQLQFFVLMMITVSG